VLENQKIESQKKIPIILVGMPGSGKSSVARAISVALDLPLIDTDVLFQEMTLKTPEAFILTFGESQFREEERKLISNLLSTENAVISTGGGLPCFHNQMAVLKSFGWVVFLQTSAEVLFNRLSTDHSRPLLEATNDKLNALNDLLLRRTPIYQQAHFTVDASDDISVIAYEIVEGWKLL
jgi:shikimate kinase